MTFTFNATPVFANFIKFDPPVGNDTLMKDGFPTNVSTKMQCITEMSEYENKSLEELRFDFYKYNRKIVVPAPVKFGCSFIQEGEVIGINPLFIKTGVSNIQQRLKEFLLNGKYNDMTLKVKDRSFRAHKIILAAQSPVFSAMMEHDTKEKATGVVEISDAEPGIFSLFLNFIYSGQFDFLNRENVIGVCTLADKYQVLELNRICVKYMMHNFTPENFCDILAFSIQHHETELTNMGTQFFRQYSSEIAATAKWAEFLSENPLTCNELFLAALRLKE